MKGRKKNSAGAYNGLKLIVVDRRHAAALVLDLHGDEGKHSTSTWPQDRISR